MAYLVSITPDPVNNWTRAGLAQKSSRSHPDAAIAGPGVLFEGRAGWVVDRDNSVEVWVAATKWANLQPGQYARFGVCEVPDVTADYRVTGWTIDRAAPSVTLVEELIDPTDVLPVVTNGQIDAALPGAIAEYVLIREWEDYDAAVEARDFEINRITAFLRDKLIAAGRKLNGATRTYLRQEAATLLAATDYAIPAVPTEPSEPRP